MCSMNYFCYWERAEFLWRFNWSLYIHIPPRIRKRPLAFDPAFITPIQQEEMRWMKLFVCYLLLTVCCIILWKERFLVRVNSKTAQSEGKLEYEHLTVSTIQFAWASYVRVYITYLGFDMAIVATAFFAVPFWIVSCQQKFLLWSLDQIKLQYITF